MATVPGTYQNPSFGAGDLKDPRLQLAVEEGHDADIPSNVGTYDKSSEVEKQQTGAVTTSEVEAEKPDPFRVDWEQPEDEDPTNPMNWPEWKKWFNIAIVAFITLITPLASSMFAPGVPLVMKDFHNDSELLATFVVSVYLLGFAFGPLIVAPLSEIYGRLPLYFVCNVLFVIFCVASALSTSLGMLIGFRFLMGCAGVAPLTIGAGTIADLMPVERRGKAMAIYAMGPLIGPVIGPVGGGYMVEAVGWRWVFWLLGIMSGFASSLSFFLMRETYAPVLLEKKAARLRKETGNPSFRSKLDRGISPAQLFKISMIRPSKMMILSPIVAPLTIYTAFAYGILYFLFTTFSFVYPHQYHFTSGQVGLAFIPVGLGMFGGLGFLGPYSDKVIKGKQQRGETVEPEDRMPLFLVLPGVLAFPVGTFIYGWTVQYAVHWIVPMMGTLLVGFGMITIFMCIQTYLVDAFTMYAASAMAANTVVRSIFGGLLPLSGLRLYNALGYGWGNSLLAFVGLAMVPVPIFFSKYGKRIRNSKRGQIKL